MKPVIYQLVPRYFGNTNLRNQTNGDLATNGCGKFADISTNALQKLRALGVTHVWLTGVLRQATLTDYNGIGLPADNPNIVKGLAGSFYAVRDYYDVCPDYANVPGNRMQEFDALVQRAHAAGLQVIIDLVSNHVSRGYHSTANPAANLGVGDDVTQFFSNQNNFFYLVQPPGQALHLSKPSSWNPPGIVFDGRFAPENGSPGHPPKATGNNNTSPNPSSSDWYETIKLNYGFNFVSRQTAYAPRPRTWDAIDAILDFWQSKGVDGFRCDFAHYVPAEAWSFLINTARQRRAAYFFAEAYPYAGSGDPVESQQALIQAGFDAVYHYQAYNALKGIYISGDIDSYDREMGNVSTNMRPHLLCYLENHDERRVASPVVSNQGAGASGFGSAATGFQLAPLHLLSGNGPVMFLNGQETGEPGAGVEGFGGEDGRTTIYDYWAMPEFAKWVNNHAYDGGGLSNEQKGLRKFYGDLFHLCQHASVAADGYWGLWYFNRPSQFPDCPSGLYSFARFGVNSGQMLLVVANFQPNTAINGQVRIPQQLSALVNLQGNITVELILDRTGTRSDLIGTYSVSALSQSGFQIQIENQESRVYLLHV